MFDPSFNFQFQDPDRNVARENLIVFLHTPGGLEFLADSVHSARRRLAAVADTEFLEELAALETKLRTASARPLPPELAV
jgi:hypothetical protein